MEDAAGVLRFAAQAKDAPVIHFNGPWSMGLRGHRRSSWATSRPT